MIQPSLFLRRALLADAIFSGIAAVLFTVDADALAPLLNLPEALLRETGLFLIAYTALVGWLGTRESLPKALVIIVIAGNAAWTIASIALLFSGAVSPNLLGEIELAEMPPLPPFAQVLADMDRFGWFGARRGCLCVHGGKPITPMSPVPLRPR